MKHIIYVVVLIGVFSGNVLADECDDFVLNKEAKKYEQCVSLFHSSKAYPNIFSSKAELLSVLMKNIKSGNAVYVKFGMVMYDYFDGNDAEALSAAIAESITVSPEGFLKLSDETHPSKARMGDYVLSVGSDYSDDFYGRIQVLRNIESAINSVEIKGLQSTKKRYISILENEINSISPLIKEQSQSAYKNSLSIFASSVLNYKSNRYWADNLLDQKNDTAWCEGKDGNGVGEFLKLKFNIYKNASKLKLQLYNGYQKNKTVYYNNSRIKKIRISIPSSSKEIEYSYDIKDAMGGQSILIPLNEFFDSKDNLLGTSFQFTIFIDEVYPGKKFDDLCVSELMVTSE